MKARYTCERCGRLRYEDRLRAVTSEAHPGQTFWICTSRVTCNNVRKANKREVAA